MPVADPLYLGAAALAGLASVGVGYWLLSRRRPNLPGLKFIYFPVASRGDAMRLALKCLGAFLRRFGRSLWGS